MGSDPTLWESRPAPSLPPAWHLHTPGLKVHRDSLHTPDQDLHGDSLSVETSHPVQTGTAGAQFPLSHHPEWPSRCILRCPSGRALWHLWVYASRPGEILGRTCTGSSPLRLCSQILSCKLGSHSLLCTQPLSQAAFRASQAGMGSARHSKLPHPWELSSLP